MFRALSNKSHCLLRSMSIHAHGSIRTIRHQVAKIRTSILKNVSMWWFANLRICITQHLLNGYIHIRRNRLFDIIPPKRLVPWKQFIFIGSKKIYSTSSTVVHYTTCDRTYVFSTTMSTWLFWSLTSFVNDIPKKQQVS